MIRNSTDPIGTNNGDPALHIDTKLNLKNLKNKVVNKHRDVHATKQMLITYPFEKVGLILIVEVNIVKAKDGWG